MQNSGHCFHSLPCLLTISNAIYPNAHQNILMAHTWRAHTHTYFEIELIYYFSYIFESVTFQHGAAVAQEVEWVIYLSEGCWFDPRLLHSVC